MIPNEATILNLNDQLFLSKTLLEKRENPECSSLIGHTFTVIPEIIKRIDKAGIEEKDIYFTLLFTNNISFKDGAAFVLFQKSDEMFYPIVYTGIALKDETNINCLLHYFKVIPYEFKNGYDKAGSNSKPLQVYTEAGEPI